MASESVKARAIIQEANEWLVQMMEPGTSAQNEADFAAWLRQSPVHVREYLRAEAVYAAMAGIDAERRIDVEALLAAHVANVVVLDQLPRDDVPATMPVRTRRWIANTLAAGVATMAVIVGGLWYAVQPDTISYATGVGEQRRVVLDDGSIVDMNTQTQLAVRMDETSRYVELSKGEALFTVAKDTQRPFTVDSEVALVRALGTQFNVYRQAEQILVTVIEGRVAVENKDAAGRTPEASGSVAMIELPPMELAAGDQAAIVAQAPIRKATANTETAVAWRERRLIFENQPLSEVVAEFNRYNRRQLVIEHPQLAKERISAVFDADQPEALVRFLTQNKPIETVEVDNERIILRVDEYRDR